MYGFIDRHWKPLALVTIVIFVLSSGVLVRNQLATGSFMQRDIDLSGGKQISIELDSQPDLAAVRAAFPEASVQLVTGLKSTLVVEVAADVDEEIILSGLRGLGIDGEVSTKEIGPLLGEIFWKQTQLAIIVAFILMAVVIFILFRSLVPSVAILLAALTDITFALAVLHLVGTKLSLAVLAGALMLIGYSVDTDIVLTTELLKTKGKHVSERLRAAMKTGLTLTLTALAAVLAMYFVSGSEIIQQIALVLLIGLAIDIPSTWLTNAGILRWWVQRKEAKEASG
jgi:preprotein translocase subunit SecF